MVAFTLVTGGAVAGATWATFLAGPRAEPVVIPVPAPAPAPVKPEVVVVEPKCPTPPPAPVVVVPAAPDPRFGQGSCPGRDAPRDPVVGQRYGEDDGENLRLLDAHELTGVAVSPRRHGYIAAWHRDSIFYSDDDGRSFREVLRGPGRVYDVVVDCRGAVFALRGTEDGFMLGYAHSREQWWRQVNLRDKEFARADDGNDDAHSFDRVSLAAGGGWVAIIAPVTFFGLEHEGTHTAIAVSDDGGTRWSYLNIPQTGVVEYADVTSIDDHGRLRLLELEGDCMYDGTALETFQLNSGEILDRRQLSTSYQLNPTVAGRWAYETRECDGPLCVLDMDRPATESWQEVVWAKVTGLAAEPVEREASTFANGRVYAHHGAGIFRVRGRKATRVAQDIPADVEFAALDSSYRLIGLSQNGRLVRWSERHGLRTLRGQTLE